MFTDDRLKEYKQINKQSKKERKKTTIRYSQTEKRNKQTGKAGGKQTNKAK